MNERKFLTIEGSVSSWTEINQVPTPTGPGQVLVSTNEGYDWGSTTAYVSNEPPTAPILGSMWWSTRDAQMRVFNGSVWVSTQPSLDGALVSKTYFINDAKTTDEYIVKSTTIVLPSKGSCIVEASFYLPPGAKTQVIFKCNNNIFYDQQHLTLGSNVNIKYGTQVYAGNHTLEVVIIPLDENSIPQNICLTFMGEVGG